MDEVGVQKVKKTQVTGLSKSFFSAGLMMMRHGSD